jgi:hypothetical protein
LAYSVCQCLTPYATETAFRHTLKRIF